MSKWKSKIVGHAKVAPDQLVANPLNFRTHPMAQREALAAAIEEVGFIRSVTVNKRTGNLIDGHERVWQALQGEEPEIDVEYVDLSEDEERKALATMDPISELAQVDSAKLDELLRDVNTGSAALQEMLSDLAKNAKLYQNQPVVEDEVPEPPKVPVTKAGDLWLLGEHRLLCGDSTKGEDVGRVMNGERAGLCFTSPPYGNQRDYTNESAELLSDWDQLMYGVFQKLPVLAHAQVLVNLGLIHRDCEWMPYWEKWINWMREHGWRRFGWYVWDQGSGLPGDWNGRFAPSHEFVFHFNRQSERPLKSVETTQQTRARKGQSVPIGFRKQGGSEACTSPNSVGQDFKIPDSVIRIARHTCDGKLHPATFPVAFASQFILSWAGDIYEPFAGSGTTIIAAEQLNRRCYGIEISPAYVDVCVQRWEKLTNGKATREGNTNGKTRSQTSTDRPQTRAGKPRQAKAKRKRTAARA